MPVYSVDTEEEARKLLIATCSTNLDGEFVARELAEERTIASLEKFGRRLRNMHKVVGNKLGLNDLPVGGPYFSERL